MTGTNRAHYAVPPPYGRILGILVHYSARQSMEGLSKSIIGGKYNVGFGVDLQTPGPLRGNTGCGKWSSRIVVTEMPNLHLDISYQNVE